MTDEKLRIGEAARRLGMSVQALRAWELRYGVPAPERTAGGLRLYPPEQVERARAMRELVDGGLAPAEAARSVMGGAGAGHEVPAAAQLPQLMEALRARLDAFEDDSAQAVLDRLFARFSADVVVNEIVLPYLADLGERWARGEASVAQEHFASTLLRSRLLALGRGWDRGSGPRAVLACPSGELHDVGLIAFGLALRAQGWRITYLGQDTPADTLAGTVESLLPAAVVIAGTQAELLAAAASSLVDGKSDAPLFFGGRGADAQALSGEVLPADPREAARLVATHAN